MILDSGIGLINNVLGSTSAAKMGEDVINSFEKVKQVLEKIKALLLNKNNFENEM